MLDKITNKFCVNSLGEVRKMAIYEPCDLFRAISLDGTQWAAQLSNQMHVSFCLNKPKQAMLRRRQEMKYLDPFCFNIFG